MPATDKPLHDSRKRIIFIHHSTGRHLINQGNVRKLIGLHNKDNGTEYEFWDCDYNRIGVTDSGGKRLGISFNIPNDNTDPDGLEILFTQPIKEHANNALSQILTFDVVIFKSCFPASAIRSEAQLEQYKKHYLSIRQTLAAHPEILFIAMTPPPLIPLPLPVIQPAWTNVQDAKRARGFANWMLSKEFVDSLPNVTTFDFFSLLATHDGSKKEANMLRQEYRGFLGLDSHPNKLANKTVAPIFVNFICASILKFREGNLNHS